jgi:hypothetical protein
VLLFPPEDSRIKNSSNETVSQPAKVAGISMIKDECDIIDVVHEDRHDRAHGIRYPDGKYNFTIPLDADEFVHCGDQIFSDVVVKEVPPGSAPLLDELRIRAKEVGQY